jgi:hypothetical protein
MYLSTLSFPLLYTSDTLSYPIDTIWLYIGFISPAANYVDLHRFVAITEEEFPGWQDLTAQQRNHVIDPLKFLPPDINNQSSYRFLGCQNSHP